MNELIAQARAFFESLSGQQRVALIAAVIASVIAVVGVVWWSSSESYDLIMVGNSVELQKAADKLEEAGVSYRYTAAGTGIEVPTASRGEAMVTAASAGLSGWQDILETIDMGTSPSVEREYRTRALEAELQKTINSLQAIESSRVHIVPLDRVTFIGHDKQASASVKVQTASPGALDRDQVRGIVQLVAGAVHGLSVDDVTLVDTDGTLLHPDSDAATAPGGRNLDEIRALREAELRNSLADAAENILGSRSAIWATVNVELATSSIQRVRNSYDPDGSVLLSEVIREEESTDRGRAAGVPGAQTNLPENAAGGGGGSETSIFENTNNYENSSVQETEIITPGDVKRVVTSVAINASALEALISDTVTENQVRQNLEKVIQGAVGFDQQRGDELIVEFIEFAAPESVEDTESLSTWSYTLEGLMPWIVSLVALVLFFLGVVLPIMNRITAVTVVDSNVEVEEESLPPLSAEEMSANELLERIRYSLNHELEPIDPSELNALVEKFMAPSTAVLRRWMKKAS